MEHNRAMPPMAPVQMELLKQGMPSAMEQAWQAHRKHLDMTLEQALDHPLFGRLLRAHAASIEAMRRKVARRRIRRARK